MANHFSSEWKVDPTKAEANYIINHYFQQLPFCIVFFSVNTWHHWCPNQWNMRAKHFWMIKLRLIFTYDTNILTFSVLRHFGMTKSVYSTGWGVNTPFLSSDEWLNQYSTGGKYTLYSLLSSMRLYGNSN